ncbi:MAG: bifunctional phosphoribosylaminoimidazolecarboxamide formyltransferase/IMP cyclohydrolase [Bacteroidetes bacterium]|nr:bifunctional phosphoribosylaminoimidazolecarboxamide formyltransferase/IMP cyclohydrolase [Bacteroidota bacterium]
MNNTRLIRSALISVYHKEDLDEILHLLSGIPAILYSTGGTLSYIKSLGLKAIAVEDITSYPSILGGRVKTLHPKVFGGILGRRDMLEDVAQMNKYEIPEIDLVIVDLYPFEETVSSGASFEEIIEKIDIGGISLIRAAAKNFNDVLIIPSQKQYPFLKSILENQKGNTTFEDRRKMANEAFRISSQYDNAIRNYLSTGHLPDGGLDLSGGVSLRYGENPHQSGKFYGNLDDVFEKLHGKEISYNNLLDIDAGINLTGEFDGPGIAILKHNNPCGVACCNNQVEAWQKALEGDPVSAFGGVIVANREISAGAAEEMNKLFFEIIVAPGYEEKALELLKSKKNRIILRQKKYSPPLKTVRTVLNGLLEQDRDKHVEKPGELKCVTNRTPSSGTIEELLFANKIVKHAKSNSIVLTKGKHLLGIGCGHVSRVDALNFAISKARATGKDLTGAVMASDAFFPFADCVEIANGAGIRDVIQPGGSVRDNDSIEFCNKQDMTMVFTGIRHFRH